MNGFKSIMAVALTVTTIGVGGLVATPSASAQVSRSVCGGLEKKGSTAYAVGSFFQAYGDYQWATYYFGKAAAYFDAARDCLLRS